MGSFLGVEYGDGSNRWIPGAVETVSNPVERVSNPYDTAAGAADALTLNFDEGVGGLTSLVDNDSGNTAGVRQQEWTPAGGFILGEDGPTGKAQAIAAVIAGLIGIVVLGQLFTVGVGGSGG